ncbi:hypothetical protein ScPMuIL_004321 [Solemya velum]
MIFFPGAQAQGHVIYDGNPRIYHSQQQMVPVVAAYPTSPTAAGYVKAFPYAYHYDSPTDPSHSRTMLLEHPEYREYYYPSENQELRRDRVVRRSQSDVTSRSTRKSRHRKPRNDSPDPKRQPVTTADIHAREQQQWPASTTSTQDHRSGNLQNGSFKSQAESHHQSVSPQRSYEAQTRTITLQENEFLPSATDSAKLRAVSGQKEGRGHQNITDDDKKNIFPDASSEESHQKKSVEECDVYAVPDKSKLKPTKNELQYLSKTANFTEEKDEHTLRQTNVSAYVRDHRVPYSTEKVTPSENERQPKVSSRVSSSPLRKSAKIRGSAASPNESADLATVGKSVTTEAFEFLESYLSDDETDVLESGKQTPLHVHVNKGAGMV